MHKFLSFCLVIALSGVCLAQSESATLSGRVTDPGGSAVVGAEVVLTNIETNVESRTKTNSAGLYVFTGVHPGKYRVAAGATGFKVLIKDGLVLHVQDELAENFALTLGTVSETVTVTADATPLNTTDASVSTVVDRKFVESLPLNGRSFNTLLQLTPGVVIAQQPSTTSAASPGQFSISGQRTDANNFSIDGVSANFGASGFNGTGATQAFSAIGGTSSLISVDALQEFRIETSSYTPEFGRQPGGQVILTTRSGTNDFHGGGFDYFRNTVMDANDWFLSEAGKPRAAEHHNDFGGIFGGPLWKNKSFFFFSYEGARLDLPQGAVFNVPSAYARAQAAGNAIAPYLDAYPQPDDRTAVPGVYTAPLTAGYSNPGTLNAASLRIDHHFNDRFSIFGRYNYAPSSLSTVFSEPNNPFKSIVNTKTLTAGINMSLSSRLWNTVRANYSTQSTRNPSSLTSFGGAVPLDPTLLLGSLPVSNNNATFATFDTGLLTVGPGAKTHTTQLNFVDDLAVKVAAHQLKFGGDYRSIFYNNTPPKYV